jgi:hypothetical protein
LSVTQERVDASNPPIHTEIEDPVVRFLLRESFFLSAASISLALQVFKPLHLQEQETGDSFLVSSHLSSGFPGFH